MEMKKFFLICVLALLGLIQSVAQEYVPFVREGVQWVCTYNNRPFTLELKGDVVIGGKALTRSTTPYPFTSGKRAKSYMV